MILAFRAKIALCNTAVTFLHTQSPNFISRYSQKQLANTGIIWHISRENAMKSLLLEKSQLLEKVSRICRPSGAWPTIACANDNKRSKNFGKRPNRRQKILRRRKIQSNLVISKSVNLNFRLYRARTLVLATSHYKRREKVGFIEHGYIKVLAISSSQCRPDLSMTFIYIGQCPKSPVISCKVR